MARVNISIPDSLYERLDRQRDRINASRICATALEKELDMIEGRTAIADPDIATLVQRLQSARERWYQRGREDGKRWAVQTATRQQLYRARDEMEGEDGAELAESLSRRDGRLRRMFGGFDFEATVNKWAQTDHSGAEFHLGRDDEDDDEDSGFRRTDSGRRAGPNGESGGATEIDLAGYMEGWRDVLEEIWQVVSTALR